MPITYPASMLVAKVELLSVVTLGVWTDITQWVLFKQRIIVKRGMGIEDQRTGKPNSIRLTLDNTDGRFSPRNVTGPYFGRLRQNTKLRVSYNVGTGVIQRAQGEVPNWTPKFPAGEARTLTIEAVDARQRIQKGVPPLNSPIYNTTVKARPVSYAALEEDDESTRASLTSGRGTVSSSGTINFGSESSLPGSKPNPTLTANSFIAINTGGHDFGDEWQVDFFMKISSAPAAITNMMSVYTNGTLPRWNFCVENTGYRLRGYNAAGSVIVDSGLFALVGVFLGQWMHVRIQLQDTSSTQYQWGLVTFPANLAGGFALGGTGVTGQVGNVLKAQVEPAVGIAGVSLAHFAIYDDFDFSAVDQSGGGYSGESPTARFLRLCDEESITGVVRSTGTDQVNMGVQRSLDFMANVRDCLNANEGYLDSDTIGRLRMTSRTWLQNQAVAMTVDHSARRAQDIVAAETDRLLVNDFTATRTGGGQAVSTITTGPMNVSDPEDDLQGVGRYPDSETYNLDSDSALVDHAGLRTYQGTIDHPAVEKLLIHFGRSGVAAALLATWLTIDTFTRIQVTNPPTDLGPDTLDQMVFGWTETFDGFELIAELNCRPSSAYSIGTVEANLARNDSEDTYLLHAITSAETTIRIANTSNEVVPTFWAHRDGDYLVRITGEDLNVTAVSARLTSSFIAAGTGASASSGSITPGFPAGTQKGDLLLIFTSTRNFGTGTPNTPSGYTRIMTVSNMGLFGKIHTGTESAPLCTFAGGAANQDTLAQMCAFRNVQLFHANGTSVRLLKSTFTLNSSAQDIDPPTAVITPRFGTIGIYFAWKQDDWSSVTSPGGIPVIGTVVSTAGNDAAMAWGYQTVGISGTSGGDWTVTGGASAISNAAVAYLDVNVQTMTVQRSQNTAVLAHAQGEQVRVKYPIVLGLPES